MRTVNGGVPQQSGREDRADSAFRLLCVDRTLMATAELFERIALGCQGSFRRLAPLSPPLAFSCMGRGVCPSCNGHAHGTDRGAPPVFLPARPITQVHLAALTERVRRRVVRWFGMQQLLDADASPTCLPGRITCSRSTRASGSRSSTATCRAYFGVSNTC